MISDVNLPPIGLQVSHYLFQKDRFVRSRCNIKKTLPGVHAITHTTWNIPCDYSDRQVMQWCFEQTRKYSGLHWVIFTRDRRFCESAKVSTANLASKNVKVLVLQKHLSLIQKCGYKVSSYDIVHFESPNLQKIMRSLYCYLWRHRMLN